MIKRLLVILTFIGLAVTAGAVTAAPAYALWTHCDPGHICIFDGTNGGGVPYEWSSGSGCINIGGSWNDKASSVMNRASWAGGVSFYEHANCSLDFDPIGLHTTSGESYSFHSGGGYTVYNNMLSSFYIW